MQYFLDILMGIYLGIGLVLVFRGPLSELIGDAVQEAQVLRAMQPAGERPLPRAAVSALILGTITVLLWPCLWPTAVCRREHLASRFAGLSTFGD